MYYSSSFAVVSPVRKLLGVEVVGMVDGNPMVDTPGISRGARIAPFFICGGGVGFSLGAKGSYVLLCLGPSTSA